MPPLDVQQLPVHALVPAGCVYKTSADAIPAPNNEVITSEARIIVERNISKPRSKLNQQCTATDAIALQMRFICFHAHELLKTKKRA
jgi:hypothetical protein